MNSEVRKMMGSFLIQVGNTDHKLSQQRWSQLCRAIDNLGGRLAVALDGAVRGAWYSLPNDAYQNACWHLEVPNLRADDVHETLCARLAELALYFDQDSIALTVGSTTLVRPRSAE